MSQIFSKPHLTPSQDKEISQAKQLVFRIRFWMTKYHMNCQGCLIKIIQKNQPVHGHCPKLRLPPRMSKCILTSCYCNIASFKFHNLVFLSFLLVLILPHKCTGSLPQGRHLWTKYNVHAKLPQSVRRSGAKVFARLKPSWRVVGGKLLFF